MIATKGEGGIIQLLGYMYDLTAVIIHDGEPNKGSYRCYVRHKASDSWFEIQASAIE